MHSVTHLDAFACAQWCNCYKYWAKNCQSSLVNRLAAYMITCRSTEYAVNIPDIILFTQMKILFWLSRGKYPDVFQDTYCTTVYALCGISHQTGVYVFYWIPVLCCNYSGCLTGTDNMQLTVKSRTLDFTSRFHWHGKKRTHSFGIVLSAKLSLSPSKHVHLEPRNHKKQLISVRSPASSLCALSTLPPVLLLPIPSLSIFHSSFPSPISVHLCCHLDQSVWLITA